MLSDQSAEEGDSAARSSWKLYCVPRVLQSRSLLVVGGVLPRAPLPQDSSSCDGHSSVCSCRLSLFLCISLSLSLALFRSLSLSHSLSFFSRGHSVSTRGTPLRAREWRLSRLARPFQRASAIPSFLPACLPPACLLACLPVCPPSPFLTLIPSFSVSHPP